MESLKKYKTKKTKRLTVRHSRGVSAIILASEWMAKLGTPLICIVLKVESVILQCMEYWEW